jgi:hypothetical protein
MKKLSLSFAVLLFAFSALPLFAQETIPLRVRVSSVSQSAASVYVDGWSAPRAQETYTLIRTDSSNSKTSFNVGTQLFWRDTSAPLGKTYTYEIQRKAGGVITGMGVSREPLNLNVKAGTTVKGVGWAAMNSRGIGWISINSESKEEGKAKHSNIPYGIFADEGGEMHGVMWAAHNSGNENGYGWLSFNKVDLEGCPDGQCIARIASDGKVYGWARFINTEEENAWGGWVQLRGVAQGNNFGLCFGDSSGTPVKVGEARIYLGGECSGNGGANHQVLTGTAWGGENIGGWFAFAANSLQIINPSGTPPFGIDPKGPHKIAIRDEKNFSANLAAVWFVDNVRGGNTNYGRIFPTDSGPGAEVKYTAPERLPTPPNTVLKASSTEETENGIATDGITVVRPYDLVCVPEGQTSIRLIITKNYKSPNYPQHSVFVRGATKTPPTSTIASSTNTMNSFAHTNLPEKTTYYYELETVFASDGYSIRTPIVSCRTGESPLPLGTVTGMNAFANSPSSIIVNWKDNSRAVTAYEFELQRMRITPDRNYTIRFEATGSNKVALSWQNKTVWVPYTQELWRSDDNGVSFAQVPGQVLGWTDEMPPAQVQEYSFEDKSVITGRSYQYKLKVCGAVNLHDIYSAPLKGGTEKPEIVCVESAVAPYMHSWSGGGEEEVSATKFIGNLTATLLEAVQEIFERSFSAADSLANGIVKIFRAGTGVIAGLFSENGKVVAQEKGYDAYFKSAIITKNPAFRDEELESDTVYLYRVSILSDEPVWSNLRAAKTLKDNRGGIIENRPVCMRNSFCDSSISGMQSGDFVESSEQQCVQNRDCVNIGRSDQGFQER